MERVLLLLPEFKSSRVTAMARKQRNEGKAKAQGQAHSPTHPYAQAESKAEEKREWKAERKVEGNAEAQREATASVTSHAPQRLRSIASSSVLTPAHAALGSVK